VTNWFSTKTVMNPQVLAFRWDRVFRILFVTRLKKSSRFVCFLLFAVVQTYTYWYSRTSLRKGDGFESISKFHI